MMEYVWKQQMMDIRCASIHRHPYPTDIVHLVHMQDRNSTLEWCCAVSWLSNLSIGGNSYLLVENLQFIIVENDFQIAEAAASGKDVPEVIKGIKVIVTLFLIIHCHLCTH